MRASLGELKVLRAFLNEPWGIHYGRNLARYSGVQGGALRLILNRLEKSGMVVGFWEQIDESKEGRRRRHYYELTAAGLLYAEQTLSNIAAILTPPQR